MAQADFIQRITDLMNQGLSQSDATQKAQGEGLGLANAGTPNLQFTQFKMPDFNSYTSDLFSNLRGFSDIQGLLAQNTEQVNRLAGLQAPTTEEQGIQTQLADLRKRADELRLSTEAGRQGIEGRAIPRSLQIGEEKRLFEQSQLEGQTMMAEEANLLNRLGLAQEARQAQINAESIKQQGTQFGIGVAQNLLNTDINLRTTVANQLRQQQQDYFARIDKLDTNAQNRLTTILDTLQGVTIDSLDPQTQLQIQQLATQAGIPFNVIEKGLEAVKNQLDFQRATQERSLNQPQIIGQDDFGNSIYGRYNSTTQNFEPINISGTGVVTIPENTLAFRNNNPGNLRFVGQTGATQGEGGFAKFSTPEQGYNALIKQVELDQSRGLSVRDFISKYAPPSENNTQLYIQQFNQALGSNDNTNINTLSSSAIAQFMAKKESGTSIQSVNADVGNKSAEQIAQEIFGGTSSLRVSDLPTKIRTSVDKELSRLRKEALSTGDLEGVMRASAGGKDVTDSFLQSFSKGVNVLGQIEELKNTIKGEALGPITGVIRSNNPYDQKAQQIKAILTSIVPNLARGIYGEVGVLTDTDIATYSKTLPNLGSTEEIANALLGITVRSIQRSLENQIRSQASGGRDMSGFVDMYTGIKDQADRLLGTGEYGRLNLNLSQSFETWGNLLSSLDATLRRQVEDKARQIILENPQITEEDLLAIFQQ